MGLDTTGMPGGGGFNLGSLGSLYSSATKLPYVGDAISGVGSALGFGSSAAAGGLYANALTGSAAAGGLYAGASTGAAVGGLYGNALTGAATTAGGGFMSAASAAMPWVGGALLVDNVLGLGIVDGIVGSISSLFGGRKTAPKFELATVGQDVDPTRHGLFENYGEGVYSRGALGTVGFYDPNTARLEETFDGFDNAKAFLDGITALDNALVGAAANLDNGAEKTQAMASAAQAVRLNAGDAAGIANQLATRTLAVVDVLDGDFSASLRGLGLDAEQITGRVVQAANTMQLLDSNSARLNLQFDASAAGAMRAADGMAQLMGGADNLNASLGSFYDTFYTEEEKLQHLTEDLSSTFASMGRELPTTRQGVRDVVESLELMGAAGQEQLATILQTTPALREYVAAMEAQQTAAQTAAQLSYSSIVGIDGALDDYNTAVSLAERLASQRRQQLQEEQRAFDQLGQLLDSLMLSNQSILDPMERLNEAQRQYAQLEIRAQAGDTQAAGQLQGASSAYLDAAAAVYGQSSSQYAMIFNEVTASVRSLEDQYGDSLATLGSIESIDRQLLREQQRARDTLTRTLSEQIQANAELSSLGGLLELLPNHLANALSGILGQAVTPNGNTYIPGGFDAEGDALLTGARGGVADAFRDVLGRDPDDSGLAYYESEYSSGRMSLDEIRRRLRDSDEANNRVHGSHATGLWNVPFDGYIAELHKGELVAPADTAQRLRELPMPNLPPMPFSNMGSNQATAAPAINLEPLLRKIGALTAELSQLRGERADDAERAARQRQAQLREQERARGRAKKGVKTV
jgi:hypothetical protein